MIRSLGEVAEALIAAWPTDDGKEYIGAVKTCLATQRQYPRQRVPHLFAMRRKPVFR